jgi:hypothetical protein
MSFTLSPRWGGGLLVRHRPVVGSRAWVAMTLSRRCPASHHSMKPDERGIRLSRRPPQEPMLPSHATAPEATLPRGCAGMAQRL